MSVILATNPTGLSSSGSGTTLVLYSEHPFSAIPPASGGNNSIALGSGAETTIAATNSLAIGLHSLARHPGAIVMAAGRFGTSGDAQSSRYMLRTNTVGITPAELLFDDGSRLQIPDDSTWTFTITVTGHRTNGTDGHAGYKFEGVIYRIAGASSIAFQGNPVKTVIAESNSAWDININADTTLGSLTLTAVGETAKIIRWVALIETLEVTN